MWKKYINAVANEIFYPLLFLHRGRRWLLHCILQRTFDIKLSIMGFSLRPPKTTQKVVPVKPPKGHFFFAGRAFERLPWWKRPNLRRLYIYIVILILTNTANGFDGSMMNVGNTTFAR